MALNYRAPNGTAINLADWRLELAKPENAPQITTIDYLGYPLVITKTYVGNAGALYKVGVDVSEDVRKYHQYGESYQGGLSAQADYDRIVEAVNANADIFDETEFSPQGDVALFFEPKHNAHIVNVLNKPDAFTYRVDKADGNTPDDKTAREVAKEKFDEIVGA